MHWNCEEEDRSSHHHGHILSQPAVSCGPIVSPARSFRESFAVPVVDKLLSCYEPSATNGILILFGICKQATSMSSGVVSKMEFKVRLKLLAGLGLSEFQNHPHNPPCSSI